MKKSEIFESFVKIAQERGLVSQAEDYSPEHTEKSFSETNPRFDSLTIEQISKLYNTKPQLPKDMEYKRNIIEDAHPESVVVSPSYDKLNGLVENENEGQAIRARITMKDPDGHLTNRKYAKKNLVLSLVRVANELDACNNEELRKLADYCLLQSSGQLKKKAWIVPAVVGVAAILGAIYAYEHITSQEGLTIDYQKLTEKITELQREAISFGTGYEYSDEFKGFLADLLEKEKMVNDTVLNFQNVMSKSSLPKTKSELAKTNGKEVIAAENSGEGQEIKQAYEKLKAVVDDMGPYLTKVHQNLNNPGFRERAIKEKGMITGLIDKMKIIHNPQADEAFFNNLFGKLNDLVTNYEKDVAAIAAGTNAGKQQEQKFTNFAASQTGQQSAPAGQTPPATAPQEDKSPEKSLEDEAKDLFGGLF